MSGALWFFFWDNNPTWGVSASSATAGGGGSKADDYYPINYEELWAIREKYLQSLFGNPEKRQKVLVEPDWPDAILTPRRRPKITR